MHTTFPSIYLGETKTLQFDFSAEAYAESMASMSVTVQVFSGSDAAPAAILVGGATFTGLIGKQKVHPTLAGVIYSLLAAGTTNEGNTYFVQAFLPVLPIPIAVSPGSGGGGDLSHYTLVFVADPGQTVFSVPGGYTGEIWFFLSGSKLDPADYSAPGGTTITLAQPCVGGESVQIVVFF